MKNVIELIKERREAAKDAGFSLLELVVAVGILLVLTVGGLLAYNGITENARKAAVDSAVSEVYTAAAAAEADNDSETTAEKVGQSWESTDGSITVEAGVDADGAVWVTGEHADSEYTTSRGNVPTP